MLSIQTLEFLRDMDAYELGSCDGFVLKSWISQLTAEILEFRLKDIVDEADQHRFLGT